MKLLFFSTLFLLLSCQDNSEKKQNIAFLRIGVLIQNADNLVFYKKQVPGIWFKTVEIKSNRSHCILIKRKKENRSDMRLVQMKGKECLLNSDAQLEELENLKELSFSKGQGRVTLRFVKDKKEVIYSWKLLERSQIKEDRSASLNCGEKNQAACYRGSVYKKNVINVCNTNNEQYFCAKGLNLYCKANKFECL